MLVLDLDNNNVIRIHGPALITLVERSNRSTGKRYQLTIGIEATPEVHIENVKVQSSSSPRLRLDAASAVPPRKWVQRG